jgi:hypothetical protein
MNRYLTTLKSVTKQGVIAQMRDTLRGYSDADISAVKRMLNSPNRWGMIFLSSSEMRAIKGERLDTGTLYLVVRHGKANSPQPQRASRRV